MSVEVKEFGSLPDGCIVRRYDLSGAGGLEITVLNYGATLQAVRFGGRDVILGFDTLDDYRENNHSMLIQQPCTFQCFRLLLDAVFKIHH